MSARAVPERHPGARSAASDMAPATAHEHGLRTRRCRVFDRAFAIGIALNLAFVAVEAFYGWKVDSLALLADAGHNLSDVIGLVLAWGGALAGRLRPDARHTYGWKRASILAAFLNALLLLVAMGSLAWEAVQRLQSPLPAAGATIMAVAGLGIIVNAATALLFLRGRHSDLNIRGAFLHMAADAMVSAGVVLAGALALVFGWDWLDPVVSLAIAALIVVGTWGLFRQSLHLLFDGVPEGVDLQAVQALLQSLPGVDAGSRPARLGHGHYGHRAHRASGDAAGQADDAFLQHASDRLQDRFAIGHVTLQVVRAPFMKGCAEPRLSPRRGDRSGLAAPALRVDDVLFQRDVVAVQLGEHRHRGAQEVRVVPVVALDHRAQLRLQFEPVFLEPAMVLLQAAHVLHQHGIAAGQQAGKHMLFLGRMVGPGAAVEELADLVGRGARGVVDAVVHRAVRPTAAGARACASPRGGWRRAPRRSGSGGTAARAGRFGREGRGLVRDMATPP